MTCLLKPGPHGSVIEIDPQLLSDAGIAGDAEVEVRRDGGMLIISAANAEADREKRFEEAMRWTFERYGETFRRLRAAGD